jgi:multicomponent Na+:H+ antiporter subunit B
MLVLDAPDVAFTEAAVGAGISTVLMLASLFLTSPVDKESGQRRLWPLLVVLATGAALGYGTLDMPALGDPRAPDDLHVAPRYLEQSPDEIGVPNVVTAVLASYRGYDTLGETAVIFTAGVGVILLLARARRTAGPLEHEPRPTTQAAAPRAVPEEQLSLLRVVTAVLLPYILLLALYVQFHGDYGPGGGFQAGVIFAACFVLYALVFGFAPARRLVPVGVLRSLMALGLLLYIGVGVWGLLKGGSFLDYSVLDAHDPLHGQHLGIFLIELGVGITVAATITSIFYSMARRTQP